MSSIGVGCVNIFFFLFFSFRFLFQLLDSLGKMILFCYDRYMYNNHYYCQFVVFIILLTHKIYNLFEQVKERKMRSFQYRNFFGWCVDTFDRFYNNILNVLNLLAIVSVWIAFKVRVFCRKHNSSSQNRWTWQI